MNLTHTGSRMCYHFDHIFTFSHFIIIILINVIYTAHFKTQVQGAEQVKNEKLKENNGELMNLF